MISQRFIYGMLVRYVETNNPKGTILYIHGLGESGLCFEKLISDEWLKDWNHIVPDLPGYGKTPWSDEPMSIETLADFLADWICKLNLRNIILIGHSMGGVTGMILCEKHPLLFKCFINVEGNISLNDCFYSSKIASYPLEELLSHGMDTLLNTLYQGGFKDKSKRTYFASLSMCDPKTLHLNSRELIELSKTKEIPERLSRLNVPNIYILGNPWGTGNESIKLLSTAGIKRISIENAGHWPFIDQPIDFIEQLINFITI